MTASLFKFTRIIESGGERWAQTIEVFAYGSDEARELMEAELESLRTGSSRDEVAFQILPEWDVREILLDAAKILTVFMT